MHVFLRGDRRTLSGTVNRWIVFVHLAKMGCHWNWSVSSLDDTATVQSDWGVEHGCVHLTTSKTTEILVEHGCGHMTCMPGGPLGAEWNRV